MSHAFVYVANTDAYIDEALGSYRTLRTHMPDVPVALVTYEHLYRDIPGITWVPLTGTYDSPIVKAEAYHAPFDRLVFLDSDTRIVRNFEEIFDILDRFDFALAHEQTRGWDYETPAPRVFSELNTGLIAFRKNERVERFFADWKRLFSQRRADSGLVADQPTFRQTMWLSEDVRFATLPSEYHFIAAFPNYISWDASFLHGRNDLAWVEKELNAVEGPRVFVPGLGVFQQPQGRRSVIRNYLRLSRNTLQMLIKGHRERERPGRWGDLQRQLTDEIRQRT